mgnify:CR=1 FL=1
MKKGWKIFWTVIISLTGAGVVFCIIALCLGVTFSQFEKAYPNGIGIMRKDALTRHQRAHRVRKLSVSHPRPYGHHEPGYPPEQ